MTNADPASNTASRLEISKVVIDLTMGLFAFTYADGITEHIQIRDHSELPTVSNFLTALNHEIVTYGRPQHHSQPTAADEQ